MTFRGAERRHRPWDERPWTRGDQRHFEDSLRETLDALVVEVSTARRQLSWLLGGLAVVAFVAGPVLAFVLSGLR